MPKLSKAAKYAVHWLNSTGLSNEDIATELSITVKQVDSVLDKVADAKESQDKITESKAKNLMITHTSGKKVNTVAIMTKEASEMGDAARINTPKKSTREVKGIFRPKP
jgi:orotate phosphoribosyltransferase-like protein